PGQIAHLNRNRSDSRFENLVYLCLEHHNEFDSRTSQSKGLTEEEVRVWRDRLHARYSTTDAKVHKADIRELDPLPPDSEYERLRPLVRALAAPSERWRFPLWQVANQPEMFAYKAIPCDGVCLIERIDLPDGRIVVVCIQTAGNPGTSITNAVEELAFQVCD